MKKLTIFTPTYNRGELLKRCYKSLKTQTNKSFVWQIIDDGSTDNTEEIVRSFNSEKIIEIVYKKKINGGKVSAINCSLKITETPLWLCLDSDDYLLPNAVELIYRNLDELMINSNLCGLISLRCNKDGKPMQGVNFPENVELCSQYEVRYKFHIEPEYAQVYKTDIIKNYKYPLADGEKYMPLSYVPDQLDQRYKLLPIRETFMVCEYQDGGITKNQKKIAVRNPEGFKKFLIQRQKIQGGFIFKAKSCITYDVMCILTRDRKIIRNAPKKILSILCIPVAYVDYLLRYKKYVATK